MRKMCHLSEFHVFVAAGFIQILQTSTGQHIITSQPTMVQPVAPLLQNTLAASNVTSVLSPTIQTLPSPRPATTQPGQ